MPNESAARRAKQPPETDDREPTKRELEFLGYSTICPVSETLHG